MSTMTPENVTARKPRSKRTRFLVIILLIVAGIIVGWTIGGGKKIKEAVAFVYGMEEYLYGYPLVMMDVTKDVLTAAASSGETAPR